MTDHQGQRTCTMKFLLGLLASLLSAPSLAFVALPCFQSTRARAASTTHGVKMSAAREAAFAHNNRRTDVRIFLTQRAIQSFIFLLISTRDPHTVRWMENNYDFANLEEYHGTGAFNLTEYPAWDSLLLDMLLRPKDVVIVSAKRRGKGHGGWSKDNPYLEERFVEFEIDIDPPALVQRIMSVREQIAKEWVADLDTFVAANEMILKSYYENLEASREDEECIDDGDDPNECIQTEHLISAYSEGSTRAYDRNAMQMLSNSIVFDERSSSPYRKGSFDLLVLLATQESVHRVLRQYREIGEERVVSFEWLRDFYIDRVAEYFDGSQEYGRADDFLEELLLTPPSMKEVDGKIELVDPFRVAEDIIRARSEIGQDWREIAEGVPVEHTDLRKSILSIRMGNQPSPFTVTKTAAESEVYGEFE